MDKINLNGRDYVAADAQCSGKIGIAITTHNRQGKLNSAVSQHIKFLPVGAEIVIVDDGSTVPAVADGIDIIRNEIPRGIAAAKNQCIASLVSKGCTEFFLFDDDCWPVTEGWHIPYIQSKEPHLMMLWGDDVFFTHGDIVGHRRPKGCMLYASSSAILSVGGMDHDFGRWGFEHENWSDRIYNAGLTTCRYADVAIGGLFHAEDSRPGANSSVPEKVRVDSRPDLAEQLRNENYHVDFITGDKVKKDPPQPVLSILVPSVGIRRNTFAPKIMNAIYSQVDALKNPDDVEVIFLSDNKKMTVGAKRNRLVNMATGDYVVFVDDDDRISDDYVTSILKAAENKSDVITMIAQVSINGAHPKPCHYSVSFKDDSNTASGYQRIPNHICAVRREFALRTPFPDKMCGEDADYSLMLKPLLRTESHIGKVIYFYDYSDATTETQMKGRAIRNIIQQSKKPVADIVFLSKCDTPERKKMTEDAISSCISGAGDLLVNCIVVEQAKGVRYKGATTIYPDGEFRYNAFANMGAKTGCSENIVFANNDLVFHDGWLKELVGSNSPAVSPADPNNNRQANVSNLSGFTNGVNFSGWCFMLSRELWNKIGGLDEDFKYWCADDSVIEQIRKSGNTPKLIPSAKVTHLISKTGSGELPDDLTWGQVALFEKKYGIEKFKHDTRYADYKKRKGITS